MGRTELELSRLTPAPWNPRRELQPGDIQWKQLQASLEEHGLVDPLIVSHPSPWLKSQKKPRGYLIIGGHQRATVLQHLGHDKLTIGQDVKIVKLDSIEQEQRLCVALNRITGEWEAEALAELVAQIKTDGEADDALGFTPADYAELLAELGNGNGQPDDPEALWQGMPEFAHQDLAPWQRVVVNFKNQSDRQAFSSLIEQPLTDETRSVWYPRAAIGRTFNKRYTSAAEVLPKYPIYIISKGRWESRKTAKALGRMGVPFRIVVEPQERDEYAAVVEPGKLLVLPFSELGQGSIPARNWVWDHAVDEGHNRHWILDDNITAFYRFNDNLKVQTTSGASFRAAEEFSDRYMNVGLSGFNYHMFASRKNLAPPFYLNTRVYSCILINHDLPFRWRGRYNEDTDLSIRALKYGLCTVLFNAFLAEKVTTMKMTGGNTDELYQDDGREKMAQSLKEQHPDVVRVTKKWGRWQHHVNYSKFRKNKLKLKPGAEIPEGIENFGMELEVDESAEVAGQPPEAVVESP